MVGRQVSTEHRDEIDGEPVFWRSEEAGANAGGASVLYVHGVPDTSDQWEPFLLRTGGVAVDLPGFGRTTKRGDFDFSIEGYGRWLDRFAEHVGLDRFRLVVHDWGALALSWAARRAASVERLAIIDAVPLLPGYRWHRLARVWRRRGLGELAMGLTTRWAARRMVPPQVVELAWPHFDQGTQRAILRLYRSADPEALAAAGARLGELTAPALVVWGEDDPYVPARFADAYAEALGGEARVLRAPGAGHWAWYDRPDLVTTVAEFVSR
ncbi:MAG: alpha/beta hydrolase [Actinobacteria bacterium]|nr:MAG: alpha/beta hydrolase [Actinomycetota bacterium]